ncbi:helix-turn-helix transcriptional regulator [Pseudonocardia sp. HH130629-09]|uniref:helix-turn-helix transcriptional regulator n=1 Tax=Pseudonocardia sp. HH130629-09 TaxID=1641402 RepID=UPI0006CB1A76|nr:LuxR family transcriptional regulator [Pseudonocardia sp. HH130629-09]ALE82603.1 SelRV [Pseudonocardia sp. HH130629-09]
MHADAAPMSPVPGPAVLHERDDDIAAVEGIVDRSFGGTGGLVVVTGPLGAGRTALLAECARRAAERDVLVRRARGAAAERRYGFGVVRQLLGGDAPDLFPAPEHPGSGPAGSSDAVSEALLEVLRDLTSARPGLLLVDDVTRADPASLRWLAHLGRRSAGLRATVVLAVPDGDVPVGDTAVGELLARADVVRPLRPLTPEGIAGVARARLGTRADDAVVTALGEVSEGNPLFLDAVVEELRAAPSDGRRVSGHQVRACTPARLRDRMAAAVRLLPEPTRRYLAALAVIGDVADDVLLARLAELDHADADAARRVAGEAGLIRPGRRPRLRHRVVADALATTGSAEERRQTHLRAATLLHNDGIRPDRVASHLLTVTSSYPRWAIGALREAAVLATRRGEPWTAIRYLRHALLADAPEADRAQVLVELASLERSVDAGLALRRVVAAVPLLAPLTARADALCRAMPLTLEGAASSVLAMLRGVAEELDGVTDPDPATRELALRLRARVLYADRHRPAGVTAAVARLDELERQPGGLPLDTPGERELACVLTHAAALSGRRTAAAVAAVGRTILAREPSAQHVHSTIGLVVGSLCMADAPEELTAWLGVALDHARAEGATATEAVVRAELAAVLVCSGRIPEAEEQVRLSFELFGEADEDALLPGLILAAVLPGLQDRAPAEHILARYGAAAEVPEGFGACLQMLRARVALDAGDPDAALEYCLDAGRRFERAGWDGAAVAWRPWAIEIRRGLGQLSEARALAEEELVRTRAWGAPLQLGRALRVLGELCGRDRAEPLLTEAVEVLRSANDDRELAHALRSLHALPDRVGHPPPDGSCPTTVQTAGFTPSVLVDLSPAGRRGGHSGATWALTRSEQRVALMAAQGRTNQEISDVLGVSVRAVEKHLTGVYRKLRVSGRSALGRMWEDGSDLSA